MGGLLAIAHSITGRYRHEFKSDTLYSEIKTVLTAFQEPLLQLAQLAVSELPAATADGLQALGFTAGSTDGADLPYYRRYRIDKKEFDADENVKYFRYQMARAGRG